MLNLNVCGFIFRFTMRWDGGTKCKNALLLYEILGQFVFVYSLLHVACRDLRFYEDVKSWTVYSLEDCSVLFCVLSSHFF